MSESRTLFIKAHLRRALELIGELGPIGRERLSSELEIGEGSTRTILDRLRKDGLVRSTSRGQVLTLKGRNELEKEPRKFLQLNAGRLTVGKVDVATIVKDASERIVNGIKQRDEAIKVGADGATVLIFEDDKFRIPRLEMELRPNIGDYLKRNFEISDGDVVIIGTAEDRELAEKGALAASESLYN